MFVSSVFLEKHTWKNRGESSPTKTALWADTQLSPTLGLEIKNMTKLHMHEYSPPHTWRFLLSAQAILEAITLRVSWVGVGSPETPRAEQQQCGATAEALGVSSVCWVDHSIEFSCGLADRAGVQASPLLTGLFSRHALSSVCVYIEFVYV